MLLNEELINIQCTVATKRIQHWHVSLFSNEASFFSSFSLLIRFYISFPKYVSSFHSRTKVLLDDTKFYIFGVNLLLGKFYDKYGGTPLN